jgi:hypothetical protein
LFDRTNARALSDEEEEVSSRDDKSQKAGAVRANLCQTRKIEPLNIPGLPEVATNKSGEALAQQNQFLDQHHPGATRLPLLS